MAWRYHDTGHEPPRHPGGAERKSRDLVGEGQRRAISRVNAAPSVDFKFRKRVHMKPHVICLMASSVDGRTLHSRWRPKGSGGDLFERVHDELAGDEWLVSRVTAPGVANGQRHCS